MVLNGAIMPKNSSFKDTSPVLFTSKQLLEKMWCLMIMLGMNNLTNITLPTINKIDHFQADNLDKILSILGLRLWALTLPMKIGTPRYMKGKEP